MPFVGGKAQRVDPKFLIDRLMKNGYSRMQASAIVGNLQRESSLISNNMNKDEGAYGLMQWRGPRFTALQQFAGGQKLPWTDPGVQADFIAREMQTTERRNAQGFLAARTIDEASAALKPVIRYGDKSLPERQMHARNFFGATPDAAPETTAAPPPSTPAAQPAVSRETSRPVDLGYQAPARGIRGGLTSIGGAIGKGIRAYQEDRMPPGLTAIGNALGRVGGAMGQPSGLALLSGAGQQMGGGPPSSNLPTGGGQPSSNLPPVDRSALAQQITQAQAPRPASSYVDPNTGSAMVTGAPGRYEQGDVLNLGQPAPATAPPGAPEPPRFPGGVPLPRQRPMTGFGMPAGAPLNQLQTVAELGSIVDPTRYDYG